ncbi:MAG TPA: A24 family peptidase [Candidatus Limnocylindria bacterium]|nr:A24 family peptidase [Candidatus Limnocylindria bacterium]
MLTDQLALAQNALLVAFVLTVVYTDWRWRRIPNAVTYPTILVGLALASLRGLGGPGAGGLLDHVAAVVLAFLVCYPFYAAGGLKAGDAKLLMAVGALKGTFFFLAAAFYGALVGGVIALGVIGVRRLAPPAPGEPPRTFRRLLGIWIPYGVALGIGTLLALAVDLGRAA